MRGAMLEGGNQAGAKMTEGGGARRRSRPAPYPFWNSCEEHPTSTLRTQLEVEIEQKASLGGQQTTRTFIISIQVGWVGGARDDFFTAAALGAVAFFVADIAIDSAENYCVDTVEEFGSICGGEKASSLGRDSTGGMVVVQEREVLKLRGASTVQQTVIACHVSPWLRIVESFALMYPSLDS